MVNFDRRMDRVDFCSLVLSLPEVRTTAFYFINRIENNLYDNRKDLFSLLNNYQLGFAV